MADSGRGEADGAFDVSDISPSLDENSHPMKTMDNGRAQTSVKEKKSGVLKSIKGSIRRAGEKSPLNLKHKGSKSKAEMENTSGSQLHPPPSPSLSVGSSSQSANDAPQSQHVPSHSRSQSDSAVSLGDDTPKSESGRWSLRRKSKKEKIGSPTPKQEQLGIVQEVLTSAEEMKPDVPDETVVVERTYTLPEIPLAPLSVMQINKLIEMEVLEEAYVNLLSMRLEFQREREALGQEDSPVDLAHKEKDLSLLYKALRTKLTDIVRQSCAFPSRNKELLVHVACIIQEEEKREGEQEGMKGWREAWRNAIQEGLRDTLKGVHLDSPEQSPSWLAVHLGLLGKAIVENLEKVKTELVSSYPPGFNVFETYVSSCHEVVGEHLKGLLGNVTETRDYHALLEFIIHRYHSEKILGSISLQPELKEEQRNLKLDGEFLDQIKTGYCRRIQIDMKSSLDKIIELEHEEMWKDKEQPEIDEGLYNSHIHMDIWTNIKGKFQATTRLDVNLEQKVMCTCLDELNKFPRRFESAFVQWSSGLQDSSLWAIYHISYINSFSSLKLWRRRGEWYAACNTIQHDWFGGGSVMVWGGISLEGRIDLYRLDNGTLTAIRYPDEILGPVVRPYAGAVGPGFLPVHNNAQPHVVCRQFLENEGIDTIDWPTGSPDLNPIAHLWDIMFRSIRCHQVALQTVQELSDALVQILEEIPQDSILNVSMCMSSPREHMESYRESCPQQVELLGREVDRLLQQLSQTLVERFKSDVKELVNEVHYFVVKEYISQLMKNNYSCKNRKNERAASKMSGQWGELRGLFQEMNSAQNWLHPVGDHLSNIVGQKNKSEIKNNLKPLIDDYPDISKKHLSAVLYFRGMIRGRERQLALQKLSELKRLSRNAGNMQHALFTEIQPAVNTDCLANIPFFCFSALIPDS
ncbi:hypothetical protein NFI96_025541 [Prochilodus magdalenae]|nr:hypothetical protein NFI96_025541 [Prochilodus magdalenae]